MKFARLMYGNVQRVTLFECRMIQEIDLINAFWIVKPRNRLGKKDMGIEVAFPSC